MKIVFVVLKQTYMEHELNVIIEFRNTKNIDIHKSGIICMVIDGELRNYKQHAPLCIAYFNPCQQEQS